jgi:hypothetical protein
MAVRIDWANPNAADSVVVYRALTKIDIGNLPAPLATLAGDATFFSDATAVRNTVYNYVVAIHKGDDVLFTQNQEYGYFPETGPGPTTLQKGTWREGYFGTVTQADLFASAELITALNLSWTANTAAAASNPWHKFILDGKILFIPQLSMAQTSLVAIYDAGLMYGTDDNGARPAGTGGMLSRNPVNQKRTVTKNNLTYLVRLPKASAAPTTELLTDFTANDPRWAEGEWNRTMGRMGYALSAITTRSRLGQLAPYTSNNGNLTYVYTQHLYSNGAGIYFGNTGFDVPTQITYNGSYYAWRPVLELQL